MKNRDKNRNRNKKCISVIRAILLCTALICAVTLTLYCVKRHQELSDFAKINDAISPSSKDEKASSSSKNSKNSDNNKNSSINSDSENFDAKIFAELRSLYEQNSDTAGYIKIPNTSINYPVMQTPLDPEYYIRKGFDMKYSLSGTPFIDAKCSLNPQSDNTIIYGHNMKDGTMFSDLLLYYNESFFQNNRTFNYYSLSSDSDECQTYEIISMFEMEVYTKNSFEYNAFTDFHSENEFNEYLSKIKSLSLYDTENTASYGDRLMTLSTCSNYNDNIRFVVIAAEKS